MGGALIWTYSEMGPLLAGLAEDLQDVVLQLETNAPSSPLLGQVNRVLPLNEILGILATYFGLMAAAVVVRFFWSLMPKGK